MCELDKKIFYALDERRDFVFNSYEYMIAKPNLRKPCSQSHR